MLRTFRSAVTGPDGSVDPGYFAMFCSLYGTGFTAATILAMGWYALTKSTALEVGPVVQNIGVAIAAVAGAFATIVGAVGLFRAGDKMRKGDQVITDSRSIPLMEGDNG